MPLLSQFLVSNLAHNFFHHFSELHQKSQHFLTLQNKVLVQTHLSEIQMSLNLHLSTMAFSIFSEQAHFCESGRITRVSNFFPKPLFIFFLFSDFFLS